MKHDMYMDRGLHAVVQLSAHVSWLESTCRLYRMHSVVQQLQGRFDHSWIVLLLQYAAALDQSRTSELVTSFALTSVASD